MHFAFYSFAVFCVFDRQLVLPSHIRRHHCRSYVDVIVGITVTALPLQLALVSQSALPLQLALVSVGVAVTVGVGVWSALPSM